MLKSVRTQTTTHSQCRLSPFIRVVNQAGPFIYIVAAPSAAHAPHAPSCGLSACTALPPRQPSPPTPRHVTPALIHILYLCRTRQTKRFSCTQPVALVPVTVKAVSGYVSTTSTLCHSHTRANVLYIGRTRSSSCPAARPPISRELYPATRTRSVPH